MSNKTPKGRPSNQNQPCSMGKAKSFQLRNHRTPLRPCSSMSHQYTPALNVDLNVDLNLNPAQPTLMGSFHGIGGIQFAGEVPVADDNPVQQPLLRSLWGFEDIQFGNEGEDEDY
ncbi:hypothetical protein FRC10_005830 [Ceratobasidium sp. 414]|nr:hypothetical protein FRC10_005830 [Ceratobasidium sp. 414]